MKRNGTKSQALNIILAVVFLFNGAAALADVMFDNGDTATVDYTVAGSLWVNEAQVTMIEPAHIMGFVITGSGAVLDIYGGQIDYLMMISVDDVTLPDGIVTVYGTDFAVDGVPVDPETTELFLQGHVLSGIYEDGTPFSYPIDCVIVGGAGYAYTQTVKLGWIISKPDIEMTPAEYDFGQTDIGETKTATVTISNVGNAGLSVQSLSIEQDEPVQFEFATTQTLPFTLEPNEVLDIKLLYTPAAEALAEATFTVFSDDPNDPFVSTELIGVGVPVVLSPAQQSAVIVEIFEQILQDGTIQGVGKKKSATNKVDTFGKMLGIADELLVGGYDEYALDVLLMIEAKCDGQKSPKDFIEGDGAVELNLLINELIDTLQNQ